MASCPESSYSFSQLLTPSQWLTLYSITSAIIAALSDEEIAAILAESSPDLPQEHIKALALNEANYTNPQFQACFEGFLAKLPPTVIGKFGVVLNLLNSTPGCLLLTYSTIPFHLQPVKIREQLLHSWTNANSTVLFSPIRAFAKTIISITQVAWSKSIPQDVLYGATGYIAKSGRSADITAVEPGEAEEAGKRGFYKFKFMEFDTIAGGEDGVRNVECDVVIVGSGCGGAVVAKRLAEEGFKVIVVEKGIWYGTDQLPLPERKAMGELFENNMMWPSEDGSLVCVTGSTFGGGGTINWCASLQTQGYVREEWANKHGLPFFHSSDYQDCLDHVSQRMGVTSNIVHNHQNSVILEGSRKLGYRAIVVPQNTGAAIDGEDSSDSANSSRMHSDSYCCFGCGCRESGEGRKMGTTQTWLPDAAKAGAEFIQDFYVDRVLLSDDKSKAIGVEGVWGNKKGHLGIKVVIKTKKVVISGGTMNSPCILLRSGLTNPNIGKNLYTHPVSMLSAYFPTPTNPWEGSPLTAACTEFENLDGLGHGVKIETSIMPPLVWMRSLPFHSPVQLKKHILGYRNAGCFICILKEKDTGSVFCDQKTGLPRFNYTPSESDRALLLKGVVALAKILYIQGAEEIVPYTTGMPPFKRHPSAAELEAEAEEAEAEFEALVEMPFWSEDLLLQMQKADEKPFEDPGINNARFQRWLKKLENYGLPIPQARFISAHQMGTCRMGNDKKTSVVDPRGRVWGTDGLYVSDASVFPSASGVNPMITTMAISHWIAGGLVKELRERGRLEMPKGSGWLN